jgi:hypothetical protein
MQTHGVFCEETARTFKTVVPKRGCMHPLERGAERPILGVQDIDKFKTYYLNFIHTVVVINNIKSMSVSLTSRNCDFYAQKHTLSHRENVPTNVAKFPLLLFIYIYIYILLIISRLDSPSEPRPPLCRGFEITLRQPHSVGLLWTSDRPVAQTSI